MTKQELRALLADASTQLGSVRAILTALWPDVVEHTVAKAPGGGTLRVALDKLHEAITWIDYLNHSDLR